LPGNQIAGLSNCEIAELKKKAAACAISRFRNSAIPQLLQFQNGTDIHFDNTTRRFPG
jgi:hypothetical protein